MESPSEVVSDVSESPPGHTCSWTDEEEEEKETGDEGMDDETFEDEDEDAAMPADLEWLEDLDLDSDGDLAVADSDGGERSYAATARMFKLRRNLDQLDTFHQQKEHDVLKVREELRICHQNIADLAKQRDKVEDEMERQRDADSSSAAAFRLRAQHRRLCGELQREEEAEARVSTALKEHELHLCEVEVELGRFSSLRQQVREEERAYETRRAQRAVARLQQENAAAHNLKMKTQHVKAKQAAMQKKQEAQCQKNIEQAQASRKRVDKYLRQTIKRLHQRQAEKEGQRGELMQKRMQAVTTLKENIAATQESLRAQQRRAKVRAQRKEQDERQLKASLQAQGFDGVRHIVQQKKLQEFQRKKEEFEERQKSKRVEIVAKILREDRLAPERSKGRPRTPPPLNPPGRAACREAVLLRYLDPKPPPPSATEERSTRGAVVVEEEREASGDGASSSDLSDQEGVQEPRALQDEELGGDQIFAEPEFFGLWDQTYNKVQPKRGLDEARLPQKAAEKQPNVSAAPLPAGNLTMPAKKAACGKEMRGPPFISKPDVIVFKDFEVGKTYRKKALLTNITYATNYCKLLGLSTQLMAFISIGFEPPGSVPAGMSCDVHAVFQPTINEDLEGEVHFASAAGPFSVAIRCTTKKCDLEIDNHLVDFGMHVVGQTISRTITLTNRGALGTRFSLGLGARLGPDGSGAEAPPPPPTHRPSVSGTQQQEASSPKNLSPDDQQSPSPKSAGELHSKQNDQELSMGSQQEQSAAPEAPHPEAPADVPPEHLEAVSDTSDITIGQVREGSIGAFDSVQLEVVFTPTVPQEAKLDFHINFSDPTSKPIPVRVRGVALSVPVWVVTPCVDLKICMYDRLYQDSIMVQSRAKVALALTFEVCPELRKHMEVLPKTGFVQARSVFNAQLKFLPRHSLTEDASVFFDANTGVLEVPVTVHVADQVRPVVFTVHAVVASSDLQFDRTEVDFGRCSVYQSVRTSVRLTNLSLLPQDFGFLGIPEFIEVQPSDGFGTLLPQETVEMDLIFSARKAEDYRFQLNCKSGINRDFPISCRGRGLNPPLTLSHSLVEFRATALGDRSTAVLYVINPNNNGRGGGGGDFGRALPLPPPPPPPPPLRGDGEAFATAGTRLFAFSLPEGSPIAISPSSGHVLPGERCLVQVTFSPALSESQIREEAARLLCQSLHQRESETSRAESGAAAEQEVKQEVAAEASKGKKVHVSRPQPRQAVNPKNSKAAISSPRTDTPFKFPTPADIQPGFGLTAFSPGHSQEEQLCMSEEYALGRASALHSFASRHSSHTVPCFVADPPPADHPQAEPTWSPLNTLYLELRCAAIQPHLVVISNNGQSTVNFHRVAVGQKVIKEFTVKNISKECLDLRSSVLDLSGPFSLLNALRRFGPGEVHTLLLAFSPDQDKKYRETLDIRASGPRRTALAVTLCGEGVQSSVTCSPAGDLLDLGYVLEQENTSRVLKLQNSSCVAVGFRVLLASLAVSMPQGGADCLPSLLSSYPHTRTTVGTQNYSGLSVFSASPMKGSIAPGQSQDVTVTFQPDHPSIHYSDRLTVELSDKSTACVMDLKGAACSHTMYVCGGDPLEVNIESLLPLIGDRRSEFTDSERSERPVVPVLLTLRAVYSEGSMRPAVRELEVGCIRSTHPGKKNGEFLWDNLPNLQQQGFTVEPSRGTVEPGQRRTVTVTWSPRCGHKPNEVIQVCAPLTLRGDETEVFNITLLALSCMAPTECQSVKD